MKYNLLIVKSDNPYNYFDNSADGIEFHNLEKNEVNELIELSLKQDFSVTINKCEE